MDCPGFKGWAVHSNVAWRTLERGLVWIAFSAGARALREKRKERDERKAKSLRPRQTGYSKTFPNFSSLFYKAPPPEDTDSGGYSSSTAGS